MTETETNTTPEAGAPIWQTRRCAVNETVELAVGTLQARITRSDLEWLIEYQYSEDRFVRSSEDAVVHTRTAFRQTDEEFVVRPLPANRNVVARPAQRLAIPAGEQATLYVGTPVWLQLATVPGDVRLLDVATEILSDTWLGPNTRSGDLAYANETQARMFLDRVPRRPQRMITTVRITNDGHDLLDIARLSIPAPQLAIFEDGGALWSSAVEIVREEELSTARLTIDDKPPGHLVSPVRICEPRTVVDVGSVSRAIGFLFG